MGTDETGRGWIGAIVGGACGLVVGGFFGALSAIASGGNIKAGMAIGALNGAICGAIGGSIAEDIATGGLSTIGTATMVGAIGACFTAGVASDIAVQYFNSDSNSLTDMDIDLYSSLRAGVQNVVITALSVTPAGLGALGVAGDIVMNSVFNLVASTGQWIYNTIEDELRQRKKDTKNPIEEVIQID